jgi:hypothetical protein
MTKDKIIVCVSASFEQKDDLLITLKKYAQYSDQQFACWDGFAFTTELLPECDALLVFNTPAEIIQTRCYPENTVAFMMEPGIPGKHPWMFKRLEQYHQVYSPIKQSANTTLSHGFLGWHFRQDYNFLKNLAIPVKNKAISCIASDLKQLEGHRLRLNFIKILRQQLPQVDMFGRGINFLPDKMDGLLPYRYSVAMENTSEPYYFTEKINDCFLAWTIPVYYGCRNIGQYFPEKSFIQLDINEPDLAIKKIETLLADDDWESRVNALREARELVLERYNPLAGAANILRQQGTRSEKKKVIIKPVYSGLLNKITNAFNKFSNI